MLDRFEPEAQQVILQATQQARRLRHTYLGTEHLLLGLLAADGTAARVLAAMGVTLPAMRSRVEAVVPAGDASIPAASEGFLPFTPRWQHVLAMADDERTRFDRVRIGSEHVLLALVREGDGAAAQLLGVEGVDLERTEREVERLSGE